MARGTALARATKAGDKGAKRAAALRMYFVLACGHRELGYNVQGAPGLTELTEEESDEAPNNALATVPAAGEGGAAASKAKRKRPMAGVLELQEDEDAVALAAGRKRGWWPARMFVDGREVPRLLGVGVVLQHLRGEYWIAPEAPGWVQWVVIDVDAHPDPRDGADAAALAQARALARLAALWRAFRFSAERQPIVLQSPGGGYHVWIPLTRGTSATHDPMWPSAEHTWPAGWARAWVRMHLKASGLRLCDGEIEVYPAGRRLRAPCGKNMVLLQPQRPDDPDRLELVPWPGTMTTRVDYCAGTITPARNVLAQVTTFCDLFEQRRFTLADLLGRPEASWDRTWGFLSWRRRHPAAVAVAGAEKNLGAVAPGRAGAVQIDEESPPGAGADLRTPRKHPSVRGRQGRHSGSDPDPDRTLSTPPDPDPDLPPDPVGELVKGQVYRRKVNHLLTRGLTEPGVRHDAVMALAFYWAGSCGLGRGATLERIEAWCVRLAHEGSKTIAEEGRHAFVRQCLAEAASYYDGYAHRWPFRGRGMVACAALGTADEAVLALVDERIRDYTAVLLSFLAGCADAAGEVGEPIELAGGLLRALWAGDPRVVVDGKRVPAMKVVIAELIRIGVLTLHTEYAIGRHGRVYHCWYRFGSGVAPKPLEVAPGVELIAPAAPPRPRDRRRVGPAPVTAPAPVPSAALTEPVVPAAMGEPRPVVTSEPDAAPELASSPGLCEPEVPSEPAVRRVGEPWYDAAASAASLTETRQDAPSAVPARPLVVAQRVVPEGLLRVLSAGRPEVAPWVVLEPAPGVVPPAKTSARAPWWVRLYLERRFSVAEFRHGDPTVVPLPGVRHLWPVYRWMRPGSPPGSAPLSAAPAAVAPLAPALPPELVDELPADLRPILSRAWRSWEASPASRPSDGAAPKK